MEQARQEAAAAAQAAQQAAQSSQTAPGVQYYNVGTPPVPPVPFGPQVTAQQAPVQGQGSSVADLALARQMLQAQDDQIREQSSQLAKMGEMLTQALELANRNAVAFQQAAASAPTSPAQAAGTASSSPPAADAPTAMEVDTGLRSRRAESYIPTLPQLNYTAMATRHAEIKIWTSYKEELTSWLCLLDDRYAEELTEAETSSVEIRQSELDVGKAARSTKLWFLLRQSLAKFQRSQDLLRLIEIRQKGASAGYEFWRQLNGELSIRSRVEGQAMREQTLAMSPPKHLKRPLDVMRWFTTELLKYETLISKRFPELVINEQEAVLHILRFLDEDAKRYLLLHQTTSGMEAMMRGLQFYDEQLRVLNFQKEHHGFASAFGSGKEGKGKEGKGKKGKDGKGKKGDKPDKPGKGKGKEKKDGATNREPSRAKKTDICRNCGKKGHWARDCWRAPKQASTVQQEQSGASSSNIPNPKAAATPNAAAAPKADPNKPTTKGDVGKGGGSNPANPPKGIRTMLEGSYFAMSNCSFNDLAMPEEIRDGFSMLLTAASSTVSPDDATYWLLDSGSSFHVVSRETLDSGHVKILSRQYKPKTVCQTATGDLLVEVGSDTHVTIEVSFLTTKALPARHRQQGDVLSNYACTCRLEAVVSDQIKHNLINLNLLCWKGWEPTLHEGLLTAKQQGVVLLPHLYGDCTWLESVAPEHPSAMYAGELMSSVGRSVGQSVALSEPRPEKHVSFQLNSETPSSEFVLPLDFPVLPQPNQHVLYTRGGHVLHEQLLGQSGDCFADMSNSQFASKLGSQTVDQSVGESADMSGVSIVHTATKETKEKHTKVTMPAGVQPDMIASEKHVFVPATSSTASTKPGLLLSGSRVVHQSPVLQASQSVQQASHSVQPASQSCQPASVENHPVAEHEGQRVVGRLVGWLSSSLEKEEGSCLNGEPTVLHVCGSSSTTGNSPGIPATGLCGPARSSVDRSDGGRAGRAGEHGRAEERCRDGYPVGHSRSEAAELPTSEAESQGGTGHDHACCRASSLGNTPICTTAGTAGNPRVAFSGDSAPSVAHLPRALAPRPVASCSDAIVRARLDGGCRGRIVLASDPVYLDGQRPRDQRAHDPDLAVLQELHALDNRRPSYELCTQPPDDCMDGQTAIHTKPSPAGNGANQLQGGIPFRIEGVGFGRDGPPVRAHGHSGSSSTEEQASPDTKGQGGTNGDSENRAANQEDASYAYNAEDEVPKSGIWAEGSGDSEEKPRKLRRKARMGDGPRKQKKVKRAAEDTQSAPKGPDRSKRSRAVLLPREKDTPPGECVTDSEDNWGARAAPAKPAAPKSKPKPTFTQSVRRLIPMPQKKQKLPYGSSWAPPVPREETAVVSRPSGESYHTKMLAAPHMSEMWCRHLMSEEQRSAEASSSSRLLPAPPAAPTAPETPLTTSVAAPMAAPPQPSISIWEAQGSAPPTSDSQWILGIPPPPPVPEPRSLAAQERLPQTFRSRSPEDLKRGNFASQQQRACRLSEPSATGKGSATSNRCKCVQTSISSSCRSHVQQLW